MSIEAMNWAWGCARSHDLSSSEQTVLVVLANFANEQGVAGVTRKRIGEFTNKSERSISRITEQLESRQLIVKRLQQCDGYGRKVPKGKEFNFYELRLGAKPPVQMDTPTPVQMDTPCQGCQANPCQGCQAVPTIDPTIDPNNNKTTTSSKKDPVDNRDDVVVVRKELEELFVHFGYADVPKPNKGEARTYTAAINRGWSKQHITDLAANARDKDNPRAFFRGCLNNLANSNPDTKRSADYEAERERKRREGEEWFAEWERKEAEEMAALRERIAANEARLAAEAEAAA